MRLFKVEPHDTNPVPGFEYHSFQCPKCHDVERRVAFSHDRQHKIVARPIEDEPEPLVIPPPEVKRGLLGRTFGRLLRGE
jgi:hypothetical protein